MHLNFASLSSLCGASKGVHLPDGDPASVQHGGRLRCAAADRQHADQNGTCALPGLSRVSARRRLRLVSMGGAGRRRGGLRLETATALGL